MGERKICHHRHYADCSIRKQFRRTENFTDILHPDVGVGER